MPRLAAAVHVQHPVTREWVVLEPGAEPSSELAAEITNPGAWEDGKLPDPSAAQGEIPPEFGFTGPTPPKAALEPEAEPQSVRATPSRRRKPTDAGA